MLLRLLCLVPVALGVPTVFGADLPAPPPPAKYAVEIRYQIDAFRNERVRQYFEMMQYLKAIGFERDPAYLVPDLEPEDRTANRLSGTIPSARVPQLLQQRHVQTVRLLPEGKKLPAEKDQPVRVHLQLHGGLATDRQQMLCAQVLEVLQALGFRQAEGYDHRGWTRLVGTLPAGQVDVLLNDLRRLPPAWKLLPAGLLSDLRQQRGGVQQVDAILEDWTNHKAGHKLILNALTRWQGMPAANEYLQTVPAAIREDKDPTVLHELLLRNLARSPQGADVLDKLFAAVLADAAASELMAYVIPRLPQFSSADVPLLFRFGAALRRIEALPDMKPPAPASASLEAPKGQEKISVELRVRMADPMAANLPTRMEVILAFTPGEEDREWQRILGTQDVVLEGRLGPIITVVGKPAQAAGLAAMPEVAGVRLPPPAVELPPPGPWKKDASGRLPGGLSRLQSLGTRGPGVRVAVVGADFRGWEKHRGAGLPERTQLVDLTRARNPSLEPDPFPPFPGDGLGTLHALAVARALPAVDLVLVRVDIAAPHLLLEAIRALNGEVITSPTLVQRRRDLDYDRRLLDKRHDEMLEKRKLALLDFGQEEEAQKRREEYRKEQARFDADERAFHERLSRMTRLELDLRELRQVRAVWNTLVWPDGYPSGGSGSLTRYLDDRPFRALWLQPGKEGVGPGWTGLFRDVDANGVMEFTPPDRPLPAGTWDRELAFLAWQGQDGQTMLDLPMGAVLRISVSWREAHDPNLAASGEDLYRSPLSDLRIKVYHQPDPKGASRPADDLEVVAASVGPPLRLDKTPHAGVYEQSAFLTVTQPGRYAIRIEGKAANDIRPPSAPTVPGARRSGELHPRLYVRTFAGAGQAVLRDHAVPVPAGMPADAQRAWAMPR
jgi:hypothetical protein